VDEYPSGWREVKPRTNRGFNTPNGILTPIKYMDTRFLGNGLTIGGAREFWIPNQQIPQGVKIFKIPF
jgi:hypothetical protein